LSARFLQTRRILCCDATCLSGWDSPWLTLVRATRRAVDYPCSPSDARMTIQVTASLTTSITSRTIITASSISAAAASTTAGLTSLLRDTLAPKRNRALRPALKHQFLREVVPPFCGSLARRERQQQQREGHDRVSPPPDFVAVLCDRNRSHRRSPPATLRALPALRRRDPHTSGLKPARLWDGLPARR